MSLTILSIADPFVPVGTDGAGLPERILSTLDAAITAAGHRSVVIAAEGSRIAGKLVAVPREDPRADPAQVDAATRTAVERAIATQWPDVLHFHGVGFASQRPPGVPALVTLHRPAGAYPEGSLRAAPGLYFHSTDIHRQSGIPLSLRLLPLIPYGVSVRQMARRHARRGFALLLGPVGPGCGIEAAIAAAQAAGVSLLLGGPVVDDTADAPDWFDAVLAPRLGPAVRLLGPLGFVRRRRFLNAARCLLATADQGEEGVFAALEALAAGAPVVALRDIGVDAIVEPGRTGFLAGTNVDLSAAITASLSLDSGVCRAAAQHRFSAATMASRYLAAYRIIVAGREIRRLAS